MAGGFYSAKVGERPETPAPPFRAEGDALKSIRVPTDDIKVETLHFNQDIQFFNNNHREFLRLYPDQWVAVYDKQVAGADADLGRLLDNMKARGHPLRSMVVRRVETKPVKLILCAS